MNIIHLVRELLAQGYQKMQYEKYIWKTDKFDIVWISMFLLLAWGNFRFTDRYEITHFEVYLGGLGRKTAAIISLNTSRTPNCVKAEHST